MAFAIQKLNRRKKQLRALIISLTIHLIAIIILAFWLIRPLIQEIDDSMHVELFDSLTDNRQVRQDIPKPKPKMIPKVERKVASSGLKGVSSAQRIPTPVNPITPIQDEIPIDAPSMIQNVTRLAPSPESVLNQSQIDGPKLTGGDGPTESTTPIRSKGSSGSIGVATRGKGSSGFGNFTKGTGTGSGYADLVEGYGKLPTLKDEIGNKLGGIIKGTGADLKAHIRIIRLKHTLSDWWQDPTAIPSLIKWLRENTPVRADISFAGGALTMTDPEIMNAPLIIMTGHEKEMVGNRNLMKDGEKRTDGFTDAERAALRKYVLDQGGTLFFDDCGLKAGFSGLIERELYMIFPEYALEQLPHDHEIYNIYYQLSKPPEGGEVFWESENKARPTKYKFHRGIYVPRTPGGRKTSNLTYKDAQGILRTTNRLGVIFNRKDYLCAMETAEIQSRTALRNRRSTDVYRFMTNLMVYALKYGGNTDRSEYKD